MKFAFCPTVYVVSVSLVLHIPIKCFTTTIIEADLIRDEDLVDETQMV